MSILKTLGLIFISLFVILIVIFFTSFRMRTNRLGQKEISLFWGAIKINEGTKSVNVFGDFVSVDGENETVKVAGMVDVDGKSDTVNISNGDILVDGKDGIVKVRKTLVKEVREEEVIISGSFDSKMLSALISLKKLKEDEIKIDGKKVGEDEEYIHIEAKDGKGKVKVDIKFD